MDRVPHRDPRAPHRRADDETTTTLSVNAGRDALAVAGMAPEELDLVIVGTCSPDYYMPATAVLVAHELGATRAAGFDLMAACSGFVFSLATATAYIRARDGAQRPRRRRGAAQPLPRLHRPQHVRAVRRRRRRRDPLRLRRAGRPARARHVQRRQRQGGDHLPGRRLRLPDHAADGRRGRPLRPHGRQGGLQATRRASSPSRRGRRCAAPSSAVDDVDQFLFHQANLRIIESVQSAVGIPTDKTYLNIEQYGNTSAASVPMALVEAIADGTDQGRRQAADGRLRGRATPPARRWWSGRPIPTRAFLAPGAQTRRGQPRRELAEVAA